VTQIHGVPDALFHPWGRTLLVGSFCLALMNTIREEEDLSAPFESLIIGVLALTFYPQCAAILKSLSTEIQSYLAQASSSVDLNEFVLDLLKRSAAAPSDGKPVSGGVNLPALAEQVWKVGVWGVLTSIVQWVFLLAQFLLESGYAVLWKILVLLFPLACGVYPVLPRMLGNLAVYAVELSLWMPILMLIKLATSEVARTSVGAAGGVGLQVVAVEVMAVLLMLSVPTVTHKFMSGAFSGDFGTSDHTLRKGRSWIQSVVAWKKFKVGG